MVTWKSKSNLCKHYGISSKLNLYRLDRASICIILFKKVSIIPEGRFPKPQGSICNIPIERDYITNILPSGADSNVLFVVKLKLKLSYRGQNCATRINSLSFNLFKAEKFIVL